LAQSRHWSDGAEWPFLTQSGHSKWTKSRLKTVSRRLEDGGSILETAVNEHSKINGT
jgi:hypothetical protein